MFTAEAKASEQAMEAKFANDTMVSLLCPSRKTTYIYKHRICVFSKKQSQVAQAKRDFELKKATYDTEVWPIFSSRFHGNLNHTTDLKF